MNTLDKKIYHLLSENIPSGNPSPIRAIKKIGIGYSDIEIKEATELAIYTYAKKIIQDTESFRDRFDRICNLYALQSNLSMRTSQSIILQQYSTPVPIAFLASYYVFNKSRKKTFLEPSAGNGFLTLALPPECTTVNELDDLRNENLQAIGYKKVLKKDASEAFGFDKEFGGVITNPPFGKMPTGVDVGDYTLTALDHVMTVRALDAMRDDGAAAIIIGGHTEYDSVGRIKAGKNRVFISYLYQYYNVEDIINISGKLYSRQGTSFDIRLILINGRKAIPEGFPPLQKNEDSIKNFEALFERVSLHIRINMRDIKEKANLLLKKLSTISSAELSGPYRPAATPPVRSLDTNVPDSMDYEIHSAINNVKEDVGSINEYVRKYLDFATEDELAKALSAEQVDAIAMIIYNIEEKGQGMVIGDQTGIGKGRIAAAVIRYACKQGYKPIFATEKANLFSDIYRDLSAIGSAQLRPFIVNSDENKTKVKDESGSVIYEALPKSKQESVFKGELPAEYDYVMMTYSQIASEKPTIKQAFLSRIARNNVLVLDESHNAGGNIETSATARYFLSTVKSSKGTVFLSATFAKRPDNMPLYAAKTCMQDASLSNENFVEAIQKGGVALQEILSANLVSEGQMVRRERTYEGIEVNYITLDNAGSLQYGVSNTENEHKAICDNITSIMRDIARFQEEYVTPIIQIMDKQMSAMQTNVEERKGTSKGGADNTPYFSKIFQTINQMLFSIKAEEVATRAIQRLKEGKAPVIAFASTMGTFLADFEMEEEIRTDFVEVLRRGLDGVLRYTIIDANDNRTYKSIEMDEFSIEAREAYNSIDKKMRSLASGINISPIDLIKTRIQAAGYSVAEVTGRTIEVAYINDQCSKGRVIPRKKELVNDAFRKFNNNEVDVLMINQSGSTGGSAHAIVTAKVKAENVRQRVMIILQAEGDINIEIQKRGRINRTGQILKPIYDYMTSAIPAEKRLMMMLQKKLKSLDANTTSSQKNSEAILKSEDFLNKYGDQLIVSYLEENPEMNEMCGDPLNLQDTEVNRIVENAASKVSGRVAVLPTNLQEHFYADMIERYQNHISYLLQTGEYDLEVEAMNLEAKTLDRVMKIAGKGGSKAFGGHTYLEKCEVNILRKPFKWQEIENILLQTCNNETGKEIVEKEIKKMESFQLGKYEAIAQEVREKIEKAIQNIPNEKGYKEAAVRQRALQYLTSRRKELEDSLEDTIQGAKDRVQRSFTYMREYIQYFYPGRRLFYPVLTDRIPAVCLGVKINEGKSNPYAPSAILIRIAIANSLKYVELNLAKDQAKILNEVRGLSYSTPNFDWDEICQKSTADRGIRYIVSGNILQAFANDELRGKLISYTAEDTVKKGVLLSESYTPKDTRTTVPLIHAIKAIQGLSDGSQVVLDNGVSIMRTRVGYTLFTGSLSVQTNGWLLKNETILPYIKNDGGFQKVSSRWKGDFDPDDLKQVVRIIYEATNATVILNEYQVKLVNSELAKEEIISETKVFPRLVELEVKLFRILEGEGFSGFSSPAMDSVMSSLRTLQQYYPFTPKNDKEKFLYEAISEVADKTDNFTQAPYEEKVEVRSLLEREGISPGEWIVKKQSFKRSEVDVINWLAEVVNVFFHTGRVGTNNLFKYKAKALKLKLELLKL